jgi:hypothetical protein
MQPSHPNRITWQIERKLNKLTFALKKNHTAHRDVNILEAGALRLALSRLLVTRQVDNLLVPIMSAD